MDGVVSQSLAPEFLALRLASGGEVTISVSGGSMGFVFFAPTAHVTIGALRGWPPFGAVVLVNTDTGLVIHRVIAHDRRRGVVVTKGDTCRLADTPVPLSAVLGGMTGIVEGQQVRVPLRIRFPWTVLIAWNSRMQNVFHKTLPAAARRRDVFRYMYKLWERIERWVS